jgi:ADP-ribose pyrophosphatase YjhB (NUDIX family)
MTALPRIGSAVVVRQGDTLLLARRAKEPNRGKWVFPGGKIEPFESIQQAAEREILEETGLQVEVAEQIGAFEIIRPPDEHRVIIFSWALPVGGTPRAASDVSDLRFCTRNELSELDLSEIVARVMRTIGWLDQPTAAAA